MKGPALDRPVMLLSSFLAIMVLAVFVVSRSGPVEKKENGSAIFSIHFEYVGMDARSMEKLITIPLEEKVSNLGNLQEIRSLSEFGRSVTNVVFKKNCSRKNSYLALNDIVDTLYASLPNAVQKPRIYSANSESRAVMCIAISAPGNLSGLRSLVENSLKKELEAVEGVAEVVLSGGGIEELRIDYDNEKMLERKIAPVALAGIIQDANVADKQASIEGPKSKTSVRFKTKINSVDELKSLPLVKGSLNSKLDHFAEIRILPREPNEIVRINGNKCIGLQIKANSESRLVSLSLKCRKILENSFLPKASYQILNDQGAVILSMLKALFYALLCSFACIIMIFPFFFQSVCLICLLAVFIAVNCLLSAAVLNLLGIELDQNTLAGISISVGLVIDTAVLMAEISQSCHEIELYAIKSRKQYGAMLASLLTTITGMVPLLFFDSIMPGSRDIAIAISIMLVVSLPVTIVFFSCFFFYAQKTKAAIPGRLIKRSRKVYTRLVYLSVLSGLKKPRITVLAYAAFFAATFVLFFISGKNINLNVAENALFASVEYENEKTAEAIDKDIQKIAALLLAEKDIEYLKTESRNGSAEIMAGFTGKHKNKTAIANSIIKHAGFLTDGFLYLPEAGGSKNKPVHEIHVSVRGDSHEKCREYASIAAAELGLLSGVSQAVLNFKKPEKYLGFIPDREAMARNGITLDGFGTFLRWNIFGPVVDKFMQSKNEIDIRIAAAVDNSWTREKICALNIPCAGKSVTLGSLGSLLEKNGEGKLYRMDGRMAASFTVVMKAHSSLSAANAIKKALAGIKTEKGYAYFLSRDYERLSRDYKMLFAAFMLSVVAILLVLTSLTENFLVSVLIASIIPVSCMLPLLVKFVFKIPLEMGDIVGIVIISGISVNNAIYIHESEFKNPLFKLRDRAQIMLVTSLTSIVASIAPALFGKGSFSGHLAASIIWGTSGSLLAALFLFPAIYKSLLKVNTKT